MAFDYKGKYWHVTKAPEMFGLLRPHLRPLQQPYPPNGVAGLSKGSDTLTLAGERGYLPMSLNLNPAYVGSHWESVEEGARSPAAPRIGGSGARSARCSWPRPTRRPGGCRSAT